MNARTAAYETLMLCMKDNLFSNIAVNNAIGKYGLAGSEKGLFTQLVYGTIEREITLDYIISKACGKNPKRLDKPVLCLLRLGIYQIKFCESIPDNAAVDEIVKIASRYASRAKGFINGVLRSVCREMPQFPPKSDFSRYLSVRYSVSQWICELLTTQYGKEKAESILVGFDSVPSLTLNTNIIRISRDELLTSFAKASPCEISRKGFRAGIVPAESKELAEGLCFVQDEASQIAGMALDTKPGMKLIDVCSCPGGKSFSAAIDMNNEGSILSCDLHENKLSLVDAGAERLGISIIKTLCHDATEAIAEHIGTADRVICDVPCSGLGVMAKKPELRYKAEEEAKALPELQYEILSQSVLYLKKGGILVYSTCTLNKNENEEVVGRFLANHGDFSAVDFDLGKNAASQNGMLTLTPDVNGTDGFFMAKLTRRS